MRKLSLRIKLAAGYGALLLMLAVVGVVSYVSLHKVIELSAFAGDKSRAAVLFKDIESRINDQRAAIRVFLLDGSTEELERYTDDKRVLAEDFAKLEPLVVTAKGRQMLAQVRKGLERYHGQIDHSIALQSSGKNGEAVAVLYDPQVVAALQQVSEGLTSLVARSAELEQSSRQQQTAAGSRATALVLSLVIAGFIVGFAMATYIARNITGRVSQMVAMIEAIAGDDLSREDMQITNCDEIGRAGTLLNSMKNNLRAILQSIAGTAEQVASASEEISANALSTATSSEAQKDQVHQVATAMQEMAATVHEVADNSTKAADSARQASETARQGGVIVEDTLGHMRSIAGSVRETAKKVQELGSRSDQIGKIVGVIDDIADQTNLLALNAAIEAARAGEQGRGFAVVADEVRKLAERTTKATKEIAEMIEQVQIETRAAVEKMQSGTQQVEKGVEVTGRAGESLKQIIGQADRVGEMVTQIATAATEQSSATEQVSGNMDQINRLVAESTEGAQQSAKACEQLSSLALELQNLVSRFKLEDQMRNASSSNYGPPRQMAADPARARAAVASPSRPSFQQQDEVGTFGS